MSAPEPAPLVTLTLDTTVGTRYYDGEAAGSVSIGDLVVAAATDQLVAQVGKDLRTLLHIEFDEDAVWRIKPIKHGSARLFIEQATVGDENNSDRAGLLGRIDWVALGSDYAVTKRAGS